MLAVAHNGIQAIELLNEDFPDVIIDTVIPHLDGISVLEKLSMDYGETRRVIILTALGGRL